MEPFQKAIDEYKSINAPKDYDFQIRGIMKRERFKRIKKSVFSVAAVFMVLFVISVNVAPGFSMALSKVPIIGSLVKIFTFTTYRVDEPSYQAHIETPQVAGLNNAQLQDALNERYLNENKQIYNDFMKEIDELKKENGGHLGVESGYFIANEDDRLLSIGRYVVNTVASSSTVIKFDTVDKVEGIMITLDSLFVDDTYVQVISNEILRQMTEQMKTNKEVVYWIGDDAIEAFVAIQPNQDFYISSDRQLVISFNKYEVAPGFMGVVEFIIPYEVIEPWLSSGLYIQDIE